MKKKPTKYRLETTYDPIHKTTLLILWNGMSIVTSRTISGEPTKEELVELQKIMEKEIS